MMKETKKMVCRVLKIMLGAVVLLAIAGFGGYYGCMVLNWLTAFIIKNLAVAGSYLQKNWLAAILLFGALTLGAMAFETLYDFLKKKIKENSTKNQK